MTNQIPVLIVGAGPTGLTMAVCLERYQIPFRIIDKQIKPVQTSNAIVIQTRTLECWDDLGLLKTALAEGNPMQDFDIYAENKKLLSVNLSSLPSAHPFILGLAQSQTEKMLGNHLKEKNFTIEMEVELIDFIEENTGISATLRHKDGTLEKIQTDWLIASDGAHSAIREKTKLDFRGKDLTQHFVLADVSIDSDIAKKEICLFLSEQGPLIIARYNSQNARIIAEVTRDAELKNAKTLTHEQLDRLLKERCHFPITTTQPIWTSGFYIHEKLISAYRKNHIFFMGDAAHIHSPAGGQGMNTGIQDAYNLAWKLAFVIKGFAKPALLDTYQDERYPLAKALLRNTTAMTYMMTTRNFLLQKIRNILMPVVLGFKKNQERLAMLITELDINYKNSPLTRNYLQQHQGPIAGVRMPDVQLDQTRLFDSVRGACYCLLIFDGKNSTADMATLSLLINTFQQKDPDFIKLVFISQNQERLNQWNDAKIFDKNGLIHQSYQITEPSLYLIRPDKYIGFSGGFQHVKELLDYLA